MAQILLLELVGRGPDKPDNVVVVGDDDQSIYRFRGASYAAFEQFKKRFETAPAWDPDEPGRAGRAACRCSRTAARPATSCPPRAG